MKKKRIAIKTRSDGVITGYMVTTGKTVPEGYTAIIEVDEGIILSGPSVVQAYKYSEGHIVRRTKKEIKKDTKKIRKRPPQTDNVYYPTVHNFENDIIQELAKGTKRIREIVLLVVFLALFLGIAASSLVSYLVTFSNALLISLISSLLLSATFLFFYFRREYGQKLGRFRVPTAIVYSIDKREVPLPRVISLGRRFSAIRIPMIISARKLFKTLGKSELLKQNPFIQSQITVFLLILNKMNEMNQMGAGRSLGPSIDIGPFAGAGMYKSLSFYVAPIEDLCPSEKDLFLVQEAMPHLKSILLPLGLSLQITFLGPDKPCMLAFKTQGLTFTLSVSMGQGNRLELSQWARTFTLASDQLYADGVVLDATVQYGGLKNRLKSAFLFRGIWSIYDYLKWCSDTILWVTDYLGWLEDDTEIPQEHAFVLVQEQPITYQAVVNTGNPLLPKIVFTE
ncbi:MAG: hypothetical protein ACFFBS_10195 [Promethearchaeota archaeon]